MVFQDPYGALAPRMRVGRAVAEPFRVHRAASAKEANARAVELLEEVGLAEAHGRRYAGELSGGQRQRVVIARALALRPALLVCDEPTSALDVSVQAQILALLKDLQGRLGLTYLFISHDLGVVKSIADRVAVMYLGSVVELGPADVMYAEPQHPYTQALLRATPSIQGERRGWDEATVGREAPGRDELEVGCKFRSRCPFAFDRCVTDRPRLQTVTEGHMVACHLVASASDATAHNQTNPVED